MNLGIETSAVQLAAKLTIVLVGAWLAQATLARQNPRWRVWLWRVVAVSVFGLLIAAMLPPLYGVPLLRPADDHSEVPPGLAVMRERPADPDLEEVRRTAQHARAVATPIESGSDGVASAMVSVPTSTASPTLARDPFTSERMAADIKAGTQPLGAVDHPQAWQIDWPRRGLILYSAVLCGLLLRLAVGLFTARRVITAAAPAPDWVRAIARQLAHDAGGSEILVRVTNRFESPVLIGVLRPTTLLPAAMLRSPSAEQDVRGAIAHEAAHATGNDLLWDRMIAVISAFVWPHPLSWRARAAHRTACERVSDRVAADFLGDFAAYQRLLARIALRVSGATLNTGLAMARRADVRDRLAAMTSCPGVPRLGRRAAAIAVCVTGAVIVLGAGALVANPVNANATTDRPFADAAPDAKAKPKTEPERDHEPARSRPEALRFTVVGSDNGQPVANAKITVRMGGSTPNVKRELTTNAEGVTTFEYPDGDRPVTLGAMVHQPGMVPYYVNFGRNLIPAALPTEKTIRMDHGKKIGGQVVDLEGNSIAEAQLSITVPAIDTPSKIHYPLLDEKTAADGTWSLDGAPLALGGLRIRIEHPRFIKSSPPVQDRTDGRYVLDPGLTLSGHVTDRSGNPIPEAHITVGRDRWGSLDEPVAVAEDGTYVVYALRPQSTWVTAEASGFAPRIKPVELDSETKPLDFDLAPGHTTRFKIINQAGEPLGGIRIGADTWNGFRSLWWKAKTDADGFATWKGAPPDAVEFHVLGSGYATLRDVVVAPRDEPHIIELPRPLRIQGIVTDAGLGKIREFRVTLGRRFPGRDGISWISHEGSTGRNGEFEVEYNESCDEVYLRIEAAGFRPWISEAIRFRESEHKVFARLETGSGPAGVVWSPDSEPVVGARLTLLTESEGMQFTSGYRPVGGKQTIVSDQDGRFEFLPLEEASLITAVHDSGYAEMTSHDVAQAGGIRLQAWAKIEATVQRGSQPLAGAKVAVNLEWQREQIVRVFSYGITGTTDANGRVTFDRVVPRNAGVIKTIEQPIGRGVTVYPERSVNVSLAPGKTAHVELGGSGVTVTGRFSVAGEPPNARHQWSLNEAATLSTDPDKDDSDSRKDYRCLIEKDGSFRAADIPPGRYDLCVNLTAVPDPNLCGYGATIGRIVRRIEVGGDDPTLDLGVIEGSWFERLGAGEKAPLFVAEGIGRENVHLGELRGRLVLIDFWATWCGPCLAEMPKLVELHKEFATDQRFQILGLSIDNSIEEAAATVEQNGWPWMCAFAGPGTSATVPARYEVQSIPEKFLVDIDGTLLYRGPDLEEIAELVRQRLAELPAGVPTAAGGPNGVQPTKIDDSFQANQPIALAMAMDNTDYRLGSKPSLNGPGLMLWSGDGKAVRELDGLGTSAWLTGPQRLAADPRRERLYFCDTRQDRVIALDRFGRQLFETTVPDLHAAAVDEPTGDVWCLTLANLSSGELLVLDAAGREKSSHPFTAFGLAYSPAEDAFWIVGKAIAKVSREGKILSSHPLPEGAYTFTDVAVDRERGGAWVLEDDHPDLPRSQRRLWKVSLDGTATATHHFPNKTVPRTLACVDGHPWLAVMKNYTKDSKGSTADREWEVQRFNLDGTPSNAIKIPASDLAVGMQTGTIWLRTEVSLLRIDRDGVPLLTIPLPVDLQSVQIVAF